MENPLKHIDPLKGERDERLNYTASCWIDQVLQKTITGVIEIPKYRKSVVEILLTKPGFLTHHKQPALL
jgi:hypothetical protein